MFQQNLQAVCQEIEQCLEDVAAIHEMDPGEFKELHDQITQRLEVLDTIDNSVFGGALNKESSKLIMDLALAFQRIGNLPLGIRFCRSLLKKVRRGGNRLILAKLLNKQGSNYLGIGLNMQSLANLDEARQLFEVEGEEGYILGAMVTMNMGLCYIQRRKYLEAFTLLKSALAKVENISQEWFDRCSDKRLNSVFCRSLILGNLGNAYLNHGEDETDPEKARLYHLEAEKHLTEAIALGIGGVTYFQQQANLSFNRLQLGDLDKSEELLEGLAAYAHQQDIDQYFLSTVKLHQVELAVAREEWLKAHDLIRETLTETLQTGDMYGEELVADNYLKILAAFADHLHKKGTLTSAHFLKEPIARAMMDGATLLLGLKDSRYDENHSQQVAELAVCLGEVMLANGVGRAWDSGEADELNPEGIDLDLLQLTGIFHDLGKIRCAWSILNLPGAATDEEETLQKNHVAQSKEILNSLGLTLAARVVAEHHERADGSGYPMGKGRTSLMGGILAVAEAFVEGTTIKQQWGRKRTKIGMLKWMTSNDSAAYDALVLDALPLALEKLKS